MIISNFASQLKNPVFLILFFIILGIVFVNGYTDASHSIVNSLSARTLSIDHSIYIVTIFNFLGVLMITPLAPTVVRTIYRMFSFGEDPKQALVGITAALISIVIWSLTCLILGIVASESHSLIAGLTGAALAISPGLSGINLSQWIKVFFGLILSTLVSFVIGYLIVEIIKSLCQYSDRRKTKRYFGWGQIMGTGLVAFLHGAQDGQKFIAVFLMAMSYVDHFNDGTSLSYLSVVIFIVAIFLGIGTFTGGHVIVKSFGFDLLKLENFEGFAGDLASIISLIIALIFGLPVSTTHTSTTAIMGVGASKRLSNVNWSYVRKMGLSWILVFPGCGLLAFLITKILIHWI
ncbi:MAG: anion permease [Tissierellia bacterium]|nr:anion permease [Tissierellia bacterium]